MGIIDSRLRGTHNNSMARRQATTVAVRKPNPAVELDKLFFLLLLLFGLVMIVIVIVRKDAILSAPHAADDPQVYYESVMEE